MKKNIILILITLCITAGVLSCSNDSYPENPTLVSPISGLILEIGGTDYVVTPQLLEDGSLSNTLLVAVKVPSTTAIVKQINISDPSASVNANVGDVITFHNNKWTIEWTKDTRTENFFVEMSFNPPPVMYLVRSGDGYSLNKEKAQTIASVTYNNLFEGYVDLSNASWNNIGLVQSDQSTYFDVSAGLGGGQSFGTFTMVAKASPGTGYFPCDGPWGDWTTNGENIGIVSPGIWKINFDATTREMILLETQWAITGTAVDALTTMTYNSATHKWILTTELSAGTLKFITVPVSPNDPTVTYGASDGLFKLSETGADIAITEAGTYQIELDLNTPFYDYTITK